MDMVNDSDDNKKKEDALQEAAAEYAAHVGDNDQMRIWSPTERAVRLSEDPEKLADVVEQDINDPMRIWTHEEREAYRRAQQKDREHGPS
jgi:hypothetical protein